MNEDVLRQFIQETLAELRVDPHMMKLLKGTSLQGHEQPGDEAGRKLAEEWFEDLGGRVSPRDRAIVTRFVQKRWPGIVRRYRGNVLTAKQTMYNLLDTRFHDLRVYDR
jgi:hypothetical protein